MGKDLKEYHDALADILCWSMGYKAAGGEGLNGLNLEGLRKLKIDLYDALYESCPLWINK